MKEPPRTTITLLAQIVNLIDRHAFQEIVNELEADKYSKGYTAWDQLIWMLLCQLGDCHSIRDISNILASLQGNLNHMKLSRPPSKSTIAYQNSKRNSDVFKRLYFKLRALLGQQQGIRGTLPCLHRKINLLDSSTSRSLLMPFPGPAIQARREPLSCTRCFRLSNKCPPAFAFLRARCRIAKPHTR